MKSYRGRYCRSRSRRAKANYYVEIEKRGHEGDGSRSRDLGIWRLIEYSNLDGDELRIELLSQVREVDDTSPTSALGICNADGASVTEENIAHSQLMHEHRISLHLAVALLVGNSRENRERGHLDSELCTKIGVLRSRRGKSDVLGDMKSRLVHILAHALGTERELLGGAGLATESGPEKEETLSANLSIAKRRAGGDVEVVERKKVLTHMKRPRRRV